MNTARKLAIVQQGTKKRVILYAFFGCRLIVIPLVALRLWRLSPSASSEQTPSLSAYEWTDVVINASLVVSCISCVSPKGFLRPFHPGQGRSTAASSTMGGSAARKEYQYPGPYAELRDLNLSANMSNRGKDGSGSKTVVTSRRVPDDGEDATVSLATAAQPYPRSKGGIARTQDWTVVHEEDVL
ncbi:uncharacterized protein LTR77_000460 [Saxophila tyrrhenica]|uniref:Integral membrane protein n=1 Tax=Saxophila tyrrhenica TaxID=1690608 RepID=A0AAV9PNC0_9PEZI|nr:hypothetical protein LTR77_000460 [Saxophila tyrrhenica]